MRLMITIKLRELIYQYAQIFTKVVTEHPQSISVQKKNVLNHNSEINTNICNKNLIETDFGQWKCIKKLQIGERNVRRMKLERDFR